MENTPIWKDVNLTDAIVVRSLFTDETNETRKSECPFCGDSSALYAYVQGGFHCFGECGGPTGQTYTNTEVLSKAREVTFDEARDLICNVA